MIEISKRLQTIASYVPQGSMVADIGTDHAYLPIYLIQNKLAKHVIAMDVKQEPLKRAAQNISDAGCQDDIELRLSDGLSRLEPGEASVITISGMGGKLMERILTDGFSRLTPDTMLILSPQSELMHFREYLLEKGFVTEDEKMLKEDGKYYVIISCHLRNSTDIIDENVCIYPDEIIRYAELKYGKMLINRRDSTLHEFVEAELLVYQNLKTELEASSSSNAKIRIVQIDKQIQAIQYVLGF